MLQLILSDFCNFDAQQVSATLHNSLLAIVNRYLILYRQPFLDYLLAQQLPLPHFLDLYFQNVDCITSRTAAYVSPHPAKSTPSPSSPSSTHSNPPSSSPAPSPSYSSSSQK